jgi:hypothetical protein
LDLVVLGRGGKLRGHESTTPSAGDDAAAVASSFLLLIAARIASWLSDRIRFHPFGDMIEELIVATLGRPLGGVLVRWLKGGRVGVPDPDEARDELGEEAELLAGALKVAVVPVEAPHEEHAVTRVGEEFTQRVFDDQGLGDSFREAVRLQELAGFRGDVRLDLGLYPLHEQARRRAWVMGADWRA